MFGESVEGLVLPGPQCPTGADRHVEKAAVRDQSGQQRFDPPDALGGWSARVRGKAESVVRGDECAISSCIVGQHLRLGGVQSIGLADEMEPEFDVVGFEERSDGFEGELAVCIVDLVKELYDVRRPAESPDEFAAGLQARQDPRSDERDAPLNLAGSNGNVLSARERVLEGVSGPLMSSPGSRKNGGS